MDRIMKHFWEKNEYVKWGLTAFLVIAAEILFYMFLQHAGVVLGWLGSVLKVLAPIIWGLVIAYILWPGTKYFQYKLFLPWLNRRFPKRTNNERTSRLLSVIVVITLALLFIGVLLWIVIPQVYTSVESIVANAPEYLQTISDFIERFFENYPNLESALLEATGNVSDSIVDWARSVVLPNLSTIVTNVSTGVYLVLRGVFSVLVGFVVACYVLYNVESIDAVSKKLLYSIFPIRRAEQITRAVNFMDGVFNGFIIGKIIDSVIIGILCYIVCSIAKMPYVVLISVIVGVTNIIPFFGPFIGAIPSGIIILLVSPVKALIFAVIILVLQQLDGNIIGPKILGSSIGINGFWVMFAIIVGGGLFGFMGMLLAVPTFAVIYSSVEALINHGLKKRGLRTETALYVHMDHIDPETKKIIPAPEPEKPEKKESAGPSLRERLAPKRSKGRKK